MTRRRLDRELVRRGLAGDTAEAGALVTAGRVLVGGAPATNPARQTASGEPVVVAPPPDRYVGRGGHKLEAALARFDVPVDGVHALDVGSSTGGFTDCLLQHGAVAVVAVDVGTHQLHERLRADPRVEVREQTDIRDVVSLDPAPALATVDVSFISLTAVLPAVLDLLAPGGTVVALVKPQFEVDHSTASRGRGVVREPATWRRVLAEVSTSVAAAGATIMDVMASPLRGASGNAEFLAWIAPGRHDAAPDLAAAVAEVP